MQVEVKRIDHLGIVAGTTRDLGIVELIDEALGVDKQEEVTKGEIVAGMILNGLGFLSKPLMLSPHFFETKSLDLLVRKGVTPEQFNRHKIGRVLDEIGEYGCSNLFNAIAFQACERENIDMAFGHADTTTYSLTGEYDSDSDTERIAITYGHSKDNRPDLKQVVQELFVTQDGGIPLMTKSWNGNESDVTILRERATALTNEFGRSGNRTFVADSKLYNAKTAKTLDKINFITRVPSSIKREHEIIDLALRQKEAWILAGKGYKLQDFSVDFYGISDQRWIVCYSEQAHNRSQKTLQRAVEREKNSIKKQLFHLQAKRFSSHVDAKKELSLLSKKWKFHRVSEEQLSELKSYDKPGRPTETNTLRCEWKINALIAFDQEIFDHTLAQRSCFVLATNLSSITHSPANILAGYKGQDKCEKGFAFIKSNEFFTTSLFLKKPSRIEALLMIMVLALLVYSIAQRRLRKALALSCLTLPNQINQPTVKPTMRWIFQLFEGIDYVTVTIDGVKTEMIQGINELRKKIINLLSVNVQQIYQNFALGG